MAKNTKSVRRFRLPEFILAALVLFSGIMLGFASGGFVINFNSVGFAALSSLQKGVHAVTGTVTGFFTAIGDLATLKKENEELVEKLKNYEFFQRSNAEIRKENERLRELLAFARRGQHKSYAAQIIGRDPESLYSGITINKGARSGIRKGMPVVAVQNGIMGIVGKVVTVGIGTSLVMPLYDMQCNISSRIQNTRDIGIVSGNGSVDAPLSMRYIRKRSQDDFSVGDIVVTSGENENYMRDVAVGTISKITVLDYDSSLDIELLPVIDFSRLETVLVVDQGIPNDLEPDPADEEVPRW
ncbi:MAG: rod shape-determining protein MreC [Treponema sp.]|nr:rod shape-determining protein MreC [Treponema sp.]